MRGRDGAWSPACGVGSGACHVFGLLSCHSHLAHTSQAHLFLSLKMLSLLASGLLCVLSLNSLSPDLTGGSSHHSGFRQMPPPQEGPPGLPCSLHHRHTVCSSFCPPCTTILNGTCWYPLPHPLYESWVPVSLILPLSQGLTNRRYSNNIGKKIYLMHKGLPMYS